MLQEFVAQHSEFVPGHLLLAKILQKNKKETEALQVLEKAASLFPDSAEIVEVHQDLRRHAIYSVLST